MSKKTPNQIREELRRQLAKQHNDDLENQRRLRLQYYKMYEEENKKRIALQQENDELKEKVRQYEDWNNRLMEFMDMTPADRETYVEELKAKLDKENKFNALMDVYGKMFYTIFH